MRRRGLLQGATTPQNVTLLCPFSSGMVPSSSRSPNQPATKAQASGGLTSKIKLSLSKQKTRNMNIKGSQSLSFAIPLAEHNFLKI